ncbi:MAG: hypothetical protein Q7J16_07230 [Candidatus Cloacimonadales bacterium]|nr:hypothetical protein [Candidatus Cloacimonadales bacterium]
MFNAFKRTFFLVFVLMLISVNLAASQFLLQKGNLFREDRYVSIDLETINQIQVVFRISPDGWSFPKDIKGIVKENLFIKQNNKKIAALETQVLENYLLASFSRNDVNIYQEFYFENQEFSEKFTIREESWPRYEEFFQFYNTALEQITALDYIAAFSTLTPFLQNAPEIEEFSITEKAQQKAEDCLKNYFTQKEMFLNTHKLKHKTQINEQTLAEIDSLIQAMNSTNELFQQYYVFSPQSGLPENSSKLITDYQEYLQNLKTRYYNEVQDMLANSDYGNNKFKLILDTLVRSLCYKDSFCLISDYKIATLNYVHSNKELSAKLNNLEWMSDFERLVLAVNLNVKNDGMFLQAACMESLKAKDNTAPQSYYAILQCLNCALNANWTDFTINMNTAIDRCSDRELLYFLERMKIAYMAKIIDNIQPNVIIEINLGWKYLEKNDFENAKNSLLKAKNWDSSFALTDFLLGKVCISTGEFSKAEIYLDSAIQKQPPYLEPLYTKLDLLIKNGKYKEAVDLINAGITSNSWFKFFMIGRLYTLQMDYAKAKKYLEMALDINAYNFDLLIFLGDTYKELNDKTGAENYYKQAGSLDPENDVFSSRLQMLNN